MNPVASTLAKPDRPCVRHGGAKAIAPPTAGAAHRSNVVLPSSAAPAVANTERARPILAPPAAAELLVKSLALSNVTGATENSES